MRPFGFDKRAYIVRGTILAFGLAAAAGYWYKWFDGTGGAWPAIIATMVTMLVIFFSEHKHYVLILAFRMLAALGLLGVLRTLVTNEPVLPGIILLALVLGIMILLGAHRRDTRWLFRDATFADNTASLELNLRSTVPRADETQGDSEQEIKAPH